MATAEIQTGIIAHSKELRERAFKLYKETRDYERTAIDTCVPLATLRSWSSRDKWATRIKTELALPALDAETARTVVRVVSHSSESTAPTNLDLAEKQDRYQELSGDAGVRIAEYAATLDGAELVKQADKLLKADAYARKALKLSEDKPTTIVQIALLSATQPGSNRSEMSQPTIRELPMSAA